jgi:hypothetical protein
MRCSSMATKPGFTRRPRTVSANDSSDSPKYLREASKHSLPTERSRSQRTSTAYSWGDKNGSNMGRGKRTSWQTSSYSLVAAGYDSTLLPSPLTRRGTDMASGVSVNIPSHPSHNNRKKSVVMEVGHGNEDYYCTVDSRFSSFSLQYCKAGVPPKGPSKDITNHKQLSRYLPY